MSLESKVLIQVGTFLLTKLTLCSESINTLLIVVPRCVSYVQVMLWFLLFVKFYLHFMFPDSPKYTLSHSSFSSSLCARILHLSHEQTVDQRLVIRAL